MSKRTAIFPLRLPASLKEAVAEASREDGTSINQFVTVAVAEKLSAMKTARFFAERRAGADVEAARRILFRQGGRPPAPDDLLPRERGKGGDGA
ncbi:MAG: toxin-antitoxin system HicB family antitoxin [Alphaproteobacteria bacterium]|nr:toxin-antitoxin system HicB family antitoxin [Alphaproteobacteria bacterium]